jgi:hypothetical protein
MRHRIWVAGLLAAAGCAGGAGDELPPAAKVFEERDRSPAREAGWCHRCNTKVFEGHRCGLTYPCALCEREAGARHLHEVVWYCPKDDTLMAARHECTDARVCSICRTDARSLLGPRGCERCHRMVAPQKVHGITTYCGRCNQEAGANHIHGKTVYCRTCLREAGQGHRCDVTRLCLEHEVEHAPDHVHGVTEYCRECHRDAGIGHRHGRTEWCWRCKIEAEWPHGHLE